MIFKSVFNYFLKEFYGKGGAYYVFAGKDCSVNLSKMEFDDKFLN